MLDCECLENCPFFNDKMANKPASSELMKHQYCHGHFEECARYRIYKSRGSAAVPSDLFPGESSRANQLEKIAQSSTNKRTFRK